VIYTKKQKLICYHHHVQLKKEMKMNPIFLINIIKSLILDKAQDLAVEHVTKAIDDNLDDTQKALLDAAIEEMPENTFKNIKELLS
jgi:fatty acid-binding protein DegV